VLNITASWEQANDDVVNVAWARDSWNDMKSFSTGGNYINFLTEDETPEHVAAVLGTSIKRLSDVKAHWDPQNFFVRIEISVPPRPSSARTN
jgi:hypothetical protein